MTTTPLLPHPACRGTKRYVGVKPTGLWRIELSPIVRPHRIGRNIQAALPTGRNARNAAHGDKRERHNAAIAAERVCAVIGNRSQKQVRWLIAIVDTLRQVIIDSTSAIEQILEPVNNTLRQLSQVRRKRNVRTVLGSVLGQRRVHARMRWERTTIDIAIGGIDVIAIGHRE